VTIQIPGFDVLPPGPRRDMVVALHELYVEAHNPPIRLLTSEPGPGVPRRDALTARTVARILKGESKTVRWGQVDTLARLLSARAQDCGSGITDEITHRVRVAAFREFRSQEALSASKLIEKSISKHDALRHDRELPLLTQEGWIPNQPIELGRVALELDTQFRTDLSEAREKASVYWPTVPGSQDSSYSGAVSEYDRPARWYNGHSFRLINVSGSTAQHQGL
jgi:hypothetical protein